MPTSVKRASVAPSTAQSTAQKSTKAQAPFVLDPMLCAICGKPFQTTIVSVVVDDPKFPTGQRFDPGAYDAKCMLEYRDTSKVSPLTGMRIVEVVDEIPSLGSVLQRRLRAEQLVDVQNQLAPSFTEATQGRVSKEDLSTHVVALIGAELTRRRLWRTVQWSTAQSVNSPLRWKSILSELQIHAGQCKLIP